MCLFKRIRRLVSENLLAVNVLINFKNSWNLQKSTFILLFQRSGPKWLRKSYFKGDMRFMDCLITRWLQTTSTHVLIERTYRFQFISNYINNDRDFAAFFSHFLSLYEISNGMKIWMSLIGQGFDKLLTPNNVLI